ncbi:MAG: hypothetical protein K6F68_03470 [Clostridiales bacterium]|nr:hypothetical protein [Clostridiales bacterium]
MGLSESLAGAMDTTRTYDLAKELSLDDIFNLIKGAGLPQEITGAFELKKGLFGKSIVFPGPSKMKAKLTVKGLKAKLTKITQSGGSGVSVGGIPVGGGGVKGAIEKTAAENAFFKALGDALTGILK